MEIFVRVIFAALALSLAAVIIYVIAISIPGPTPEDLREISIETFERLNKQRTDDGAGPLVWDNDLEIMAIEHSNYMAATHDFNHSNFNYDENIAEGFRTVAQLYEVWRDSPPHSRAMYNPLISHAAIGISFNGTRYATFLAR